MMAKRAWTARRMRMRFSCMAGCSVGVLCGGMRRGVEVVAVVLDRETAQCGFVIALVEYYIGKQGGGRM